MAKKNHFYGDKKVSAKHSTTTDSAVPVINSLQKIPNIKKIRLGIIRSNRSRERWIKISSIQGGIKIVVHGSTSLQEIFVYTDSSVKELSGSISEALKEKFVIKI